MGDNLDWKKLIRMVAIIGGLCLFVGIATRVMQKNQTSLTDYAKKNPEVAFAVHDKDEAEDEKFQDEEESEEGLKDGLKDGLRDGEDSSTDKKDSKDSDKISTSDLINQDKTGSDKTGSDKTGLDKTESGKNGSGKTDSEKNKSEKAEIDSKDSDEIYKNFYYIDLEEGYKFHILYYDSSHLSSTAELTVKCEDPDKLLSLYYDLYKGEHEFGDIAEIISISEAGKSSKTDSTSTQMDDDSEEIDAKIEPDDKDRQEKE